MCVEDELKKLCEKSEYGKSANAILGHPLTALGQEMCAFYVQSENYHGWVSVSVCEVVASV